ncbi:MAG: RNA polymerase sigma-70 factor [Candidatus Pedobacter colombiensis]|uniref:RNA polymerase sigma-70 factor n=1 Tax=Candidatus Pedobacter colombiensis TaxID=3121371 RepID=A0AAJ5WC67_9SPHI|nr:RNA polymerase sigma-70 factor [Pedobacter sp.]WEK20022.1 MAG: RNA polymerase sigma-70 factor [Pedobacter sp.]
MNAYKIHTDQELTTLLKQDSQAAFKQVFDSWHKKLFHFSLRYLNCREQAEEVVHDTLLSFWSNRQNIDIQYPIGSLLYTICKRLCLNRIREAARLKAAADALWANYLDISHSTEDALNLAELEVFTEKALQQLPKQQQLVFRMSRYEGLSHKEIADELQISKETVKKHSAEALKSLRIHFDAYGLLWFFMFYLYKH